MESTKFFTAIFFNSEKKAFKYRNIANKEPQLANFLHFAKSKGAVEVNLYDKFTKQFIRKIIF
jgi:hypothetical protein